MKNRNWLKGLGITMIAATLFLTGCGNGDAEKIDTEEQIKMLKRKRGKLKLRVMKGSLSMNNLLQ